MLNTITFNTWPPTELSLHRQDSASGNTKHNNVKHGIRWPTVATDRVVTTTVWVYITHSLEDAHRQGMLNYTIYQHLTQRQVCHWRQLPQVSLSLLQTFLLQKKACLSRQNFCCDKHIFVVCHNKHNFVTTKVLSEQAYVCHKKLTFATTNASFVATKVCSSRQKFCRDKYSSTTNITL